MAMVDQSPYRCTCCTPAVAPWLVAQPIQGVMTVRQQFEAVALHAMLSKVPLEMIRSEGTINCVVRRSKEIGAMMAEDDLSRHGLERTESGKIVAGRPEEQ